MSRFAHIVPCHQSALGSESVPQSPPILCEKLKLVAVLAFIDPAEHR